MSENDTVRGQRSRFAQALYDLLTCDPVMTMDRWALWLNPWYTNRKPDGTPGTTNRMLGGGDIFEEVTTEQAKTEREEFRKNWVPNYTINKGITIAQIESWCDDEALPSPRDLIDLMGYIQFMPDTPEVARAVAAFHATLTVYAGDVSLHGRSYVFATENFGTIGARIVMEQYGVIRGLLSLPQHLWDPVFNEIAILLQKHRDEGM